MLTDAASLWPDSRIADFIADFLHMVSHSSGIYICQDLGKQEFNDINIVKGVILCLLKMDSVIYNWGVKRKKKIPFVISSFIQNHVAWVCACVNRTYEATNILINGEKTHFFLLGHS